MADKKRCAMCGRLYEACDHCEEVAQRYMRQYGQAPWRTIACSVECFQLYDIVRRYGFGQLTKDEARELMGGIHEMPDLAFVPEAAAVVDEILASQAEPVAEPEAPVEPEVRERKEGNRTKSRRQTDA